MTTKEELEREIKECEENLEDLKMRLAELNKPIWDQLPVGIYICKDSTGGKVLVKTKAAYGYILNNKGEWIPRPPHCVIKDVNDGLFFDFIKIELA